MKPSKKKYIVRIPREIYDLMLLDLSRPHEYAYERVGFFSTNLAGQDSKHIVVNVTGYHKVDDSDYIRDKSVGAKINGNAIRRAMERIIISGMGCLHVHLHDHTGNPSPSFTDLESLPDLSEAFWNTNPDAPSGYIIVSQDSFYSEIGIGQEFKLAKVDQMSVIGYPMKFAFLRTKEAEILNTVYSRQTFLGQHSQRLFSNVQIGVVGLGGGGSHVVQQMAHLGIINYSLFDGDHIEDSNHNRLIGGWFSDILRKYKKTYIAKRLIKKINPRAQVKVFCGIWQEFAPELKKCDIILGCVDTFEQRSQLETACRQSLIPYVDIGMDVFKSPISYSIAGQIILSMPGQPCMRCMGFITEKKLAKEAEKYGAAGANPQVVWPNGVLASTAVGIIVELVTGRTKENNRIVYLSYDGDSGHINDHPRVEHCAEICSHYRIEKSGNTIFRRM